MQELNEIGKSLRGSVLVIGFSDDSKLVKDLKNNKNLDIVYTLTSNVKGKKKKNKKKKKKLNGERNIDIKKLKKELKDTKDALEVLKKAIGILGK